MHLPQSTFASGVLAITFWGLRHPGEPTTQALAFSPTLALHHLPANALQREAVRLGKSGLSLTRWCRSHHLGDRGRRTELMVKIGYIWRSYLKGREGWRGRGRNRRREGEGKEGGRADSWRRTQEKGNVSGRAVLPYLGMVLKGAHLAAYHRAIFLATTESLFQAHLDIVTGVFVSTI